MAMARPHLPDISITRWDHCITRRVRRAFLLGEGPAVRKVWINHRLKALAESSPSQSVASRNSIIFQKKLSDGRLPGRVLATKRDGLPEVARALGVHHLANLAGLPGPVAEIQAVSPSTCDALFTGEFRIPRFGIRAAPKHAPPPRAVFSEGVAAAEAPSCTLRPGCRYDRVAIMRNTFGLEKPVPNSVAKCLDTVETTCIPRNRPRPLATDKIDWQ
jgi:hypothetical protein